MKRVDTTQSRTLAIKIVRSIMTPGGTPFPADHLKLYRDGEYIAGWGQKPLTDFIERLLVAEYRERNRSHD